VVAGLDEALAVGLQPAVVDLGDDLEVFPDRGVGDGRVEPTHDEFEHLPLVVAHVAAGRNLARGVNRRVVGRLLVTFRRIDLVGLEQRLGGVAERGVADELVQEPRARDRRGRRCCRSAGT